MKGTLLGTALDFALHRKGKALARNEFQENPSTDYKTGLKSQLKAPNCRVNVVMLLACVLLTTKWLKLELYQKKQHSSKIFWKWQRLPGRRIALCHKTQTISLVNHDTSSFKLNTSSVTILSLSHNNIDNMNDRLIFNFFSFHCNHEEEWSLNCYIYLLRMSSPLDQYIWYGVCLNSQRF